MKAIPGGAVGPTALASRLGSSRVLVSRTLNAIASEDPLVTMQRVPGPETLRAIVKSAGKAGAPAKHVAAALRAIDRFGILIRGKHGTRSALNAAICANAPSMQRRQELESRQRVFQGMRELRGVEAEAWLSASIVVPDRDDASRLTVLMLQGFVALRRLRLDVPVIFDFLAVGEPGAAPRSVMDVPPGSIGLEDLYAHSPAPLELTEVGGQKAYRLAQDQLGKHAVSDMLSVVHMPRCVPRYASAERRLLGPFALPKTPVRSLVFDILLAEDVADGSAPELLVFSPGPRAGLNVNERVRDIDRVEVPERVEVLPPAPGRFDLPEVPNYRKILGRLAVPLGHDVDALRLHRVKVPYPLFGYEFVSTFRLPAAPGAAGGDRAHATA